MAVVEVPCDGCTLCCRGDAVRILPDEDVSQWKTEPHEYFPGERMLAHDKNHNCIYLGEGGCTIHDHRPEMCGTLDCRQLARLFSFTKARKLSKEGKLHMSVWRRGKDLLKTHPLRT